MSEQAVRWSEFGGHRGLRDPARASRESWGGLDVARYSSGLLGPRSGLQLLDIRGITPMPNGAVGGPWGFEVFDDKLYVYTTKLHEASLTELLSQGFVTAGTFTGTTAANPGVRVPMVRLGKNLHTVEGGTVWRYDLTAKTAAAQAPGFVPTPGILAYWQRQMFAVEQANPNRLRFTGFNLVSNIPDYSLWPADYWIDIGGPQPITAVIPWFNTLYVAKQSSWWSVTGVPGIDFTLRQVALGHGPPFSNLASVTPDGKLMFHAPDWFPATFNGAISRGDDYHRFRPPSGKLLAREHGAPMVVSAASGARTFYGINAMSDASVGVAQLHQHDSGAWFSHELPFPLAGIAPGGDISQANAFEATRLLLARRCHPGQLAPQVYAFNFLPDRPGYSSAPPSRPYGITRVTPLDVGDLTAAPVEATLELSPYRHPQGVAIRCRAVMVSFRKWDTGGGPAEPNLLAVTVTAEDTYEAGGNPSRTQEWVEVPSKATAIGVDGHVRFGFGDQGWGNGFSISLRLRGVAIREVVAIVETRSTRT